MHLRNISVIVRMSRSSVTAKVIPEETHTSATKYIHSYGASSYRPTSAVLAIVLAIVVLSIRHYFVVLWKINPSTLSLSVRLSQSHACFVTKPNNAPLIF